MANVVDNYVERTAFKLLRSLHRTGGKAPLHRVQFTNSIIQYLLDISKNDQSLYVARP